MHTILFHKSNKSSILCHFFIIACQFATQTAQIHPAEPDIAYYTTNANMSTGQRVKRGQRSKVEATLLKTKGLIVISGFQEGRRRKDGGRKEGYNPVFCFLRQLISLFSSKHKGDGRLRENRPVGRGE